MSEYSVPRPHPVRNWYAELIFWAFGLGCVFLARVVWTGIQYFVALPEDTSKPLVQLLASLWAALLATASSWAEAVARLFEAGGLLGVLALLGLYLIWRIGATVDARLELLSEQVEQVVRSLERVDH